MKEKVHAYGCEGGDCTERDAQLRRLPYSSDGAMILCHSCYSVEIHFRKYRNLINKAQIFELPAWDSLKIVE